MIKAGLCSITFRSYSVNEIINIMKNTKLEVIEWGGDVHVPHGNIEIAKMVKEKTEENCFRISSYGSYYRIGEEKEKFIDVIKTAISLGVSMVRIWAGNKESQKVDLEYLKLFIKESKEILRIARDNNIELSFEYHKGTLTDTLESTKRLCEETGIKTYWQPYPDRDIKEMINELEILGSYITNIHIFNWDKNWQRKLLIEDMDKIKKIIEIVRRFEGIHNVLIEFVKDDKLENFYNDTETLTTIIKGGTI